VLHPNGNPEAKPVHHGSGFWRLSFPGMGFFGGWRAGAFDGIPMSFSGPWFAPIVLWALAIAIGIPGSVSPSVGPGRTARTWHGNRGPAWGGGGGARARGAGAPASQLASPRSRH